MAGPNRVVVELEVDGEGRVTAALRGTGDEAEQLKRRTDEAGKAGRGLREVFTGNLLADFFQRGITGAIQFGAETVRAAAVASDATRVLEFSATQAGLAFTDAAELAEDFARRVGASNTEAAGTFSDLVRLAERAGRAGDVDLVQRRFADLAAARGLRGSELQALVGTILSGQDEGLNRLGLPDPSKLYAQYAAQLGKTAESLSETEKAQAALNAVLLKGAEAEGQAEARLRGTAGQLDTAGASWTNFKTQVGEAVTASIEFRDLLFTVNDALGGLVTSHAAARRELALGLKSPAQLAAEQSGGLFNQALDAFKDVSGQALGAGALFYDLASGETSADSLRRFTAASYGAGDRRRQELEERYRAELENIRRQEQEAEERADENAAKAAEAARRAARQQQFTGQLDSALGEENLTARLERLRAVREEASKLLDGAEVEKQTKKIDDALEKTRKEVEQTVSTARDALRSFLNEAAAAADKDNPFVSLFVRARDEAEETRKKFLVFGEDFADAMARVREESIQAEIATARLHSSLQALKYGQEARRLEGAVTGLTGPEERALATVGARIGGAVQGTAGEALAEALRAGRTGVGASALARRQFDELLKLEGSLTGLEGRGAEAARDALDAQFKSLYAGLDEKTKAEALQYGPARARFSSAFAGDALRAERDIRDAVEREQAGAFIQEDARELLAAIRASGLTDRQKVQEFLGVTGALSDKELTGDLRRARVDALRAGAAFEAQKERDGEARAARIDGVMQKLDRALSEKGLKLDAETAKVQIEVTDKTGRANVTGDAW
ncbi:MAG: hypothetical protein ABW208_10150 [Pyrinomonadaceae bacterium]